MPWSSSTKQALVFQESLALARELGVPDGIAFALYCLGFSLFFRGDHEQAMALFTEELPLSHAIGQRYLVVESRFYMEMITLRQGEFEQAKALAREALAEEIRGDRPEGEFGDSLCLTLMLPGDRKHCSLTVWPSPGRAATSPSLLMYCSVWLARSGHWGS